MRTRSPCYIIYIPIWLDLLLDNRNYQITDNTDLHSNMVRFIINIVKYK